jgi:hypothetical protein
MANVENINVMKISMALAANRRLCHRRQWQPAIGNVISSAA